MAHINTSFYINTTLHTPSKIPWPFGDAKKKTNMNEISGEDDLEEALNVLADLKMTYEIKKVATIKD